MNWIYNDGGRGAAGYKGEARDCVCRSAAIITGRPYEEIYERINALGQQDGGRSSARTGVQKATTRRLMDALGLAWVPTMKVGAGCKVHLRDGELPMGRIVVQLSRHVTAVIDGVIHDTHDPGRGGTRCVYGYWVREPER